MPTARATTPSAREAEDLYRHEMTDDILAEQAEHSWHVFRAIRAQEACIEEAPVYGTPILPPPKL